MLDVQEQERVSVHKASLLLADFITKQPMSTALRRSLGIHQLESHRLAARLREYVRYDQQHPMK